MKFSRFAVLTIAAIAAFLAPEARALEGSGTEDDPYLIGTYAELQDFALHVMEKPGACAVLMADIAATDTARDWTPIGNGIAYAGTFDGAGHKVSGLSNADVAETPEYAGLFGRVANGGTVRNVRVANADFNASNAAGGIAGENSGTVSNCWTSGSVRGNLDAGGVVGYNDGGTVVDCRSDAAVGGINTGGRVAGVVANNHEGGVVTNCCFAGSLFEGRVLGGVVGHNAATVANSYCHAQGGGEVAVASSADSGTVVGECRALSETEFADEASFAGWDFGGVWLMRASGPIPRLFAPVARIGAVEYDTLEDALDAQDSEEVVTILRDFESPYASATPAGQPKDISINLNGHTVRYGQIIITGSLSITNGTIEFFPDNADVGSNYTLRFENATATIPVSRSIQAQWMANGIALVNSSVTVEGALYLGGGDGFTLSIDATSCLAMVFPVSTYNPGNVAAQIRPYLPPGCTTQSEEEVHVFAADGEEMDFVELRQYGAPAPGPVPYLDPTTHTTNTCETYTLYDGRTTLGSGWWVVADNATNDERIVVSGDVHLILVDGKTLTASRGVNVGVDGATTNSLTIWAQSDGEGMGALTATGDDAQAGIGSDFVQGCGSVTVNGGKVKAAGNDGGAGIGGGYYGAGGTVTVNGGTVKATGNDGGAGIGGGREGAGDTVTVNGGTVIAIGGTINAGGTSVGGAGIGGGYLGAGGTITINGGKVEATGDFGGAGIGGGYNGVGGTVTVNDGTVTAIGGTVTAIAGDSGGAGIGGGRDGAGGSVTINGGKVEATGNGGGAGIGGGYKGAGGEITISGGAVTAVAGEYISQGGGEKPQAVGHGQRATDEGDLDFPGTYCAYSPETNSVPVDATNRMAVCRGERVKLTLCDPHGYADYRNNGANHTRFCRYCGAEGATEDHAYVNYVCPCGAVAPAAVSNVQAAASSPWDGTVGISFYVTNSPAAVCPGWNAPFLSIVATDNVTGSNYVSVASALTGQTDAAPGGHVVTWDLAAQGINLNSTNVTFTVTYLKMPDYCVIDLSGEPGTGNQEPGTESGYAVSYLDAEPEGGFTNDLYRTGKLAMRLLAPGTFTMGDLAEDDNQPHTVTLTRPFYCAVFETTQKQWELVTGRNPSQYQGDTRPVEKVSYNDIRGASLGSLWPETNSVDEASFLGVLRLKTGLRALDLPTEAQWEYACRAGTMNLWCFGDSEDEAGDYMWHRVNTADQTHEVGTKRPNAWGLYDMHGNVWEWCLDWYFRDVNGGNDPKGSSSGSDRVRRGGGWDDYAGHCTSSYRSSASPSDDWDDDYGFRLVRTLSDNLEGERSAEAAAGAERAGTVCAGTSEPVAVVPLRPFEDGDIELTDCAAVYDGEGHTIGVTNNVIPGLTLRYAAADVATASSPSQGSGTTAGTPSPQQGPGTTAGTPSPQRWSDTLPSFVNVTNVVVFVEASAPGYVTKTNSATVKITPLSLSGATIEPIPDQYYEGTAPTPPVSVQIGGLRPAAGTDYDATYADNEGPGTATVTLTGKGNYTNETFATFQILAASRSLAVTAGKWGRVMVVVDGATNWVAAGTADVPADYGSSVTAAAVPDAGFAVVGDAFATASYTENTNLVFSFVPNPDATLRWKFSSAVGRYFAQVAIPAHAGYDEALEGLAYLFADRTNNVGDVYAQLWNAATRGPQGVLVTDGGVPYRGVALGAATFAGMPDGATNVFGVADASFEEPRNIVPAGERQIGLYVRKRVDPVSGNETVAEVGNFLGYLTWTTDGTRWFLPIVEGANSSTPNSSTPNSSLVTRHSSLASASRRAYAPATLNAAVALGLGAETVADNPPVARIAAFEVGADGAVSGRIEAVAGGETSSSFGAATVRVLSAETPAGPWREASAEVDPATGAFSLPAGAVDGHFFRAEIEAMALYE